MQSYINLVLGVTNFPAIKNSFVSYNTTGSVSPALINFVYGIDSNNAEGAVQGVFETEDGDYSPSAMALFMKSFNIDFLADPYVITTGDDGNDPSILFMVN